MTQNISFRRVAETAARRLAEAFAPETIDALIEDAKAARTPIDGVDGLLNQMTKAVLERTPQAEATERLGYDSGLSEAASRRLRERDVLATAESGRVA